MKFASRNRAVERCSVAVLLGLALRAGLSAQTSAKPKEAQSASQAGQITDVFIGDPKEGSGYETGPLRIVYADGTEVMEKLPPLKASTEKETVFNAVGFSDVQLADDGETLGWAIKVENCCTSYSIPLSVVVFRDKKILHTISPGLMIWSWKFIDGGKKVEVVSGTVHGSDVGDDQIYDVQTGKLLSEKYGDESIPAPKSKSVPARPPNTSAPNPE